MSDATRLAEIRTRCERATEGPWSVDKKGQSQMCFHISAPGGEGWIVKYWDEEDAGVILKRDADFIAHAREDVPWLLKQLGKADAARVLCHVCGCVWTQTRDGGGQ